ncbi:MAG: hypothetical protein AAF192_17680 [Pseudomonadota bacterium]
MLYGRVAPDLSREQIVFLHIRKTAGTALAASLAEGLGARPPVVTAWPTVHAQERGLLALHGPLRRAAVNAGEGARALALRLTGREAPSVANQPFIAGHWRLDAVPPGPRPRHYVTLLRDPLDRLLSDHAFMRGKRDRARGDALDPSLYDLDLEAFAEAVAARPELYQHDYQCRQLAGAPDAAAAIEAADRHLWLAAPVSRLPEFLELAGRGLGVRFAPPPVIRPSRGRARAEALAPRLRARLAALNPGDAALFAQVSADFDRLLTESG